MTDKYLGRLGSEVYWRPEREYKQESMNKKKQRKSFCKTCKFYSSDPSHYSKRPCNHCNRFSFGRLHEWNKDRPPNKWKPACPLNQCKNETIKCNECKDFDKYENFKLKQKKHYCENCKFFTRQGSITGFCEIFGHWVYDYEGRVCEEYSEREQVEEKDQKKKCTMIQCQFYGDGYKCNKEIEECAIYSINPVGPKTIITKSADGNWHRQTVYDTDTVGEYIDPVITPACETGYYQGLYTSDNSSSYLYDINEDEKEVNEMEKIERRDETLEEIKKRIEEEKESRINLLSCIVKNEEIITKKYPYFKKDGLYFDEDFLDYCKLCKGNKKILKKLCLKDDWTGNPLYDFKPIGSLGHETWLTISILLNIIKDKIEQYKQYKAKKELCHLTECYKDKTKTVRKKIALKTCERCGAEIPVEAKYCSECGGIPIGYGR